MVATNDATDIRNFEALAKRERLQHSVVDARRFSLCQTGCSIEGHAKCDVLIATCTESKEDT